MLNDRLNTELISFFKVPLEELVTAVWGLATTIDDRLSTETLPVKEWASTARRCALNYHSPEQTRQPVGAHHFLNVRSNT